MSEAYVTLATSNPYAVGALVLGHSLLSVGTTRQLCILVTPGVSDPIRSLLAEVFHNVVPVNVLDSNDSAHLSLLKRPELGVTLTKLHCWTLIQYTKCVFLDADMLAIQNADELFEQPELSAVPDVGWPDIFNSGLFVFVPSMETYGRLLQRAEKEGSFDGGDQGLLNTFFSKFSRLSFIYNMVISAVYTYLPAFKRFGKDVKFVHFLGSSKPWQQSFNYQSGTVNVGPEQQQSAPYLNCWWRIFVSLVQPGLSKSVQEHHPISPSHPEQAQLTEIFTGLKICSDPVEDSRLRWESGQPDYQGAEAFDKIWSYIEARLKTLEN